MHENITSQTVSYFTLLRFGGSTHNMSNIPEGSTDAKMAAVDVFIFSPRYCDMSLL
jgi:hypothetical protein